MTQSRLAQAGTTPEVDQAPKGGLYPTRVFNMAGTLPGRSGSSILALTLSTWITNCFMTPPFCCTKGLTWRNGGRVKPHPAVCPHRVFSHLFPCERPSGGGHYHHPVFQKFCRFMPVILKLMQIFKKPCRSLFLRCRSRIFNNRDYEQHGKGGGFYP